MLCLYTNTNQASFVKKIILHLVGFLAWFDPDLKCPTVFLCVCVCESEVLACVNGLTCSYCLLETQCRQRVCTCVVCDTSDYMYTSKWLPSTGMLNMVCVCVCLLPWLK